jgi:hypothetical protein
MEKSDEIENYKVWKINGKSKKYGGIEPTFIMLRQQFILVVQHAIINCTMVHVNALTIRRTGGQYSRSVFFYDFLNTLPVNFMYFCCTFQLEISQKKKSIKKIQLIKFHSFFRDEN